VQRQSARSCTHAARRGGQPHAAGAEPALSWAATWIRWSGRCPPGLRRPVPLPALEDEDRPTLRLDGARSTLCVAGEPTCTSPTAGLPTGGGHRALLAQGHVAHHGRGHTPHPSQPPRPSGRNGGLSRGGTRNRATPGVGGPARAQRPPGYRIANNHIHHCGTDYSGASASFLGMTQEAVIAHKPDPRHGILWHCAGGQ